MSAPLNAPRLGDTAGSPDVVPVRRRRRRPSGEPPPLPHKINASGKWWLILAVCVGGISVLLALSSRSLVNLVVADNAILQRIADIRTAWLTNVMKAIGLLATGPAMQALWLVNLVIMVIWRRWRHLLVWLVTGLLVVDGTEAIAEVIQRHVHAAANVLFGVLAGCANVNELRRILCLEPFSGNRRTEPLDRRGQVRVGFQTAQAVLQIADDVVEADAAKADR